MRRPIPIQLIQLRCEKTGRSLENGIVKHENLDFGVRTLVQVISNFHEQQTFVKFIEILNHALLVISDICKIFIWRLSNAYTVAKRCQDEMISQERRFLGLKQKCAVRNRQNFLIFEHRIRQAQVALGEVPLSAFLRPVESFLGPVQVTLLFFRNFRRPIL